MTARREPRHFILLVGIALVVASLPRAGTGGVQVEVETARAEGVACCPHDQTCSSQSTAEAVPSTPPPGGDDCCPVGCDGCFLPCCAGTVSLQGASPPPVGPELGWPSPLPRYHASCCSVDPPTIYRPPRS